MRRSEQGVRSDMSRHTRSPLQLAGVQHDWTNPSRTKVSAISAGYLWTDRSGPHSTCCFCFSQNEHMTCAAGAVVRTVAGSTIRFRWRSRVRRQPSWRTVRFGRREAGTRPVLPPAWPARCERQRRATPLQRVDRSLCVVVCARNRRSNSSRSSRVNTNGSTGHLLTLPSRQPNNIQPI